MVTKFKETKLALPCKHEDRVTKQVRPTVDLLKNMDQWHPNVLKQHGIEPADYHGGLVFRSAVESIRGTYIASQTTGRQALVKDVLDNMKQKSLISNYEQRSSRQRYDFEVEVQAAPQYFCAIEVKGGEGNSINISDRPLWAQEFAVWSHLDGAVVNQPAHGAHSVINRITNEMVKREKQVDILFFKDLLCGTRARPCPKYQGQEDTVGLNTAPDVFLFPQQIPTLQDPKPPVHTLNTLRLPGLILDLFGIAPQARSAHVWEVEVEVMQHKSNMLKREVRIKHQGKIVDSSISRPWTP